MMKRSAPWYLKNRRLLFTVGVVVLISLIVGMIGYIQRSSSPFPQSMARAITFVVYYPAKTWQTDTAHATFTNGVVNFTTRGTTATISITEQATPAVFNDIPQYYPALLTKLNQYENFGTINGTVYLTKPTELAGRQSAVLNNNGTLLFARPNHNMNVDDWRRFFNSMSTIR
jgi:hypothetical protein